MLLMCAFSGVVGMVMMLLILRCSSESKSKSASKENSATGKRRLAQPEAAGLDETEPASDANTSSKESKATDQINKTNSKSDASKDQKSADLPKMLKTLRSKKISDEERQQIMQQMLSMFEFCSKQTTMQVRARMISQFCNMIIKEDGLNTIKDQQNAKYSSNEEVHKLSEKLIETLVPVCFGGFC